VRSDNPGPDILYNVGQDAHRPREPDRSRFRRHGRRGLDGRPRRVRRRAGDRFCPVEEGATAYRALQQGELAVLPHTAGGINTTGVRTSIEFFERYCRK